MKEDRQDMHLKTGSCREKYAMFFVASPAAGFYGTGGAAGSGQKGQKPNFHKGRDDIQEDEGFRGGASVSPRNGKEKFEKGKG